VKRIKNKKLLTSIGGIFLICLLAVMLLLPACSEQAPVEEEPPVVEEEPPQVFELKFAGAVPSGLYEKEWSKFANDIEELTDGRVKITIYFDQTLGKATDQLDMLETGIADIIYHIPPWTPGVFPLSELPALPFICSTPTALSQYAEYLLQWDKCTEYDDYKVLVLMPPPSVRYYFVDKKVTTADEMNGMKLRTVGGTYSLAVSIMGASPVSIATPEVYMSLERGIIDGLTTDPGFLELIRGWEVLKYGTTNPIASGIHQVLMSKKVWDSLPCELQVIIDEYCQGFWSDRLMFAINWEERAQAALVENGLELYDISSDEIAHWQELAEPAVEGWIEEWEAQGIPAREAVEIARKISSYNK